MINLHVWCRVRVKVCFIPRGSLCCDTLLSVTVFLTSASVRAQLTILSVSLFSGFHFVLVILVSILSSASHCLNHAVLYGVLTSDNINQVVKLSDTQSNQLIIGIVPMLIRYLVLLLPRTTSTIL